MFVMSSPTSVKWISSRHHWLQCLLKFKATIQPETRPCIMTISLIIGLGTNEKPTTVSLPSVGGVPGMLNSHCARASWISGPSEVCSTVVPTFMYRICLPERLPCQPCAYMRVGACARAHARARVCGVCVRACGMCVRACESACVCACKCAADGAEGGGGEAQGSRLMGMRTVITFISRAVAWEWSSLAMVWRNSAIKTRVGCAGASPLL